jgi:hypothetical protein
VKCFLDVNAEKPASISLKVFFCCNANIVFCGDPVARYYPTIIAIIVYSDNRYLKDMFGAKFRHKHSAIPYG